MAYAIVVFVVLLVKHLSTRTFEVMKYLSARGCVVKDCRQGGIGDSMCITCEQNTGRGWWG